MTNDNDAWNKQLNAIITGQTQTAGNSVPQTLTRPRTFPFMPVSQVPRLASISVETKPVYTWRLLDITRDWLKLFMDQCFAEGTLEWEGDPASIQTSVPIQDHLERHNAKRKDLGLGEVSPLDGTVRYVLCRGDVI